MNCEPPLLHVLGAGPWQLATIRRAQHLGCRVLVTDGSPAPPGFGLADLHAAVDITDRQASLREAQRQGIDGVLCDTTDNGVVAAAYVAEQMGLPGPGLEAALRCTDKARMTACAAAAGLRVPSSFEADSIDAALAGARGDGPWVVKPVDNQSGRGVSVVRRPDDLQQGLATAFEHSRRRQVLVQAFITGQEVIVDSLVVDGQAHRLGVAIKTPYVDNPTISSRITYGDATLGPKWVARVDAVNRSLIQALGLRQGLVHAEYILSGDEIYPIDVAARGGGVHIYPLVLQHVSGVDVMRCAIDLALGRPVDVQPRRPGLAANIEFLRCRSGLIRSIRGLQDAAAMPEVATVHMNRQAGQNAGQMNDKDQRLGHVVTLASSPEDAVAAGMRAAHAIQVDVD